MKNTKMKKLLMFLLLLMPVFWTMNLNTRAATKNTVNVVVNYNYFDVTTNSLKTKTFKTYRVKKGSTFSLSSEKLPKVAQNYRKSLPKFVANKDMTKTVNYLSDKVAKVLVRIKYVDNFSKTWKEKVFNYRVVKGKSFERRVSQMPEIYRNHRTAILKRTITKDTTIRITYRPSVSLKKELFTAPSVLKTFNAYGNVMSAGYYDFTTGSKTSKNGSTLVTSASTYKLFTALYVLHLIDSKKISWNSRYGNTTIRGGFHHMIVYSSNTFSEWIMRKYGAKNIDKYLRSKGYKGVYNDYRKATTCANDLVNVLRYYYQHRNNSNVKYLLGLMNKQVYRDGIPKGSSSLVANKVGFLWDIRNDAGIVYDKHPYILVVMTKKQTSFKLISNVSKQVNATHRKMFD